MNSNLNSIQIQCGFFSKRFKWTGEHEVLLLREVLASEIWNTKPGSTDRRDGWKKIVDTLSQIERPSFDVSIRSVREHFQTIFAKRKSQIRKEESASGISPETSERDVILDELIDLFEAATSDQQSAVQEMKEKQAAERKAAEEMRRMTMETLGESRKRRRGDEKEATEKKRNVGKKPFEIVQEKIQFDVEMKERELSLKEKEIAEKARHRETIMEGQRQQERERSEIRLMLQKIDNRLDEQDRTIREIMGTQKRQEKLLQTILEKLNQ